MKDSILKLYGSAVRMGSEWEPDPAKVTAPGLVFWGSRDAACQVAFADELGRAIRAERVIELDCSHWTVLQRPAQVARALEEHWRCHEGTWSAAPLSAAIAPGRARRTHMCRAPRSPQNTALGDGLTRSSSSRGSLAAVAVLGAARGRTTTRTRATDSCPGPRPHPERQPHSNPVDHLRDHPAAW
ncbi:alpha/beta fold hydrolase [Nonomuraea basaltis]|uniref:alpha/beta fold hydrolase n=1 Tax=Nonomuraea basaltis TaxID=2495887 RepID=UPI00110C4BE8|nr:hypothetical protein [Nonomuraea basaltis]TMR99756.1 hypothetical protein EJK15_05655 [Nonomuraea basaltis]